MSKTGPYDSSLFNDLVSWSVTADMRGSYSARVTLTNSELKWQPEMFLWQPFQVRLDSSVLEKKGFLPKSYFEGDLRWVFGLVSNFDETEGIPEKQVVLSISSFASRLNQKPVNSGEHSNSTDALEAVAHEIGGLHPSLTDFESSLWDICGVVTGDNMLEEMRRVAQAGGQDLFVNREGILVSQGWKDHDSPVDVVVPPEAVLSAKRRRGIDSGPTRYRVRGCWEWQDKIAGPKEQSQQNSGSNPRNPISGRGKMIYCIANGVPKPVIDLLLKDIPEEKKEALDVEVTGAGEYVGPGNMQSQHDYGEAGKHSIRLSNGDPDDPESFYPKGQFQATLSAQSRDQSPETTEAPVLKSRRAASAGKEDVERLKALMRMWGAGVGRGPHGRHAGGAGGAGAHGSPDKTADEQDEVQLEVVVDDPDLQDEFGVIVDEIDNPYILNRNTAFEIAVRSFQEFKMARKTWDFEVTYMTCLDVGQKITITTPEGREITGLLTAITVDYSPDPKATMKLTVESMEDLGTTTYSTDSNLLVDGTPSGEASEAWSYGGAFGRPNIGVYFPYLSTLDQFMSLTPGDEYTFSADSSGAGTITLSVIDSGIHAFGPSPVVFTPDEVANFLKLENLAAGTLLVTNIKLTKTKVA